MKNNRQSISAIAFVLFVFLANASVGQSIDSSKTYVWLKEQENVIRNRHHLAPFFEQLYQLKSLTTETVSIVHIGDSHIQADFMTEVVRRSLQREFGNAGRGLVVPGRVAGTNEPLNIRTSSTSNWSAKRIIHPQKPLPIGIGGITIHTTDPGSALSLRMRDAFLDYSFNRIGLFHSNKSSNFTIAVYDTLATEIGKTVYDDRGRSNFSLITLPHHYSKVEFRTLKENEGQQSASIFGFNLENGNAGVLYHAVGVNGARYEHYNAATFFYEQSKMLFPHLVIISLGTNESVEYPNINPQLPAYIQNVVERLRGVNPQAVFMLVTPSDFFIRKVKPNPGVEVVRKNILDYAVDNGIAFYDGFKVYGGKGSAKAWKDAGLLRPDGVHFSREGYALQGKLLFEAIMKGYREYVSDRHP